MFARVTGRQLERRGWTVEAGSCANPLETYHESSSASSIQTCFCLDSSAWREAIKRLSTWQCGEWKPACSCQFKGMFYGCVLEPFLSFLRTFSSPAKLVYKHQSFGLEMGRLYLSQHATVEAFLLLKACSVRSNTMDASLNGLWCGCKLVLLQLIP